jgi:hypothetical protein
MFAMLTVLPVVGTVRAIATITLARRDGIRGDRDRTCMARNNAEIGRPRDDGCRNADDDGDRLRDGGSVARPPEHTTDKSHVDGDDGRQREHADGGSPATRGAPTRGPVRGLLRDTVGYGAHDASGSTCRGVTGCSGEQRTTMHRRTT